MDNLTRNIMDQWTWPTDRRKDASATQQVGKLVFDHDRSRYLQEGFWAAMYDEVRQAPQQIPCVRNTSDT